VQDAREVRVGQRAGPTAGVDCATRTDKPARAETTAAAKPLGPVPTTVTSTSQVDRIRLAG
jgi:hypothetical protein